MMRASAAAWSTRAPCCAGDCRGVRLGRRPNATDSPQANPLARRVYLGFGVVQQAGRQGDLDPPRRHVDLSHEGAHQRHDRAARADAQRKAKTSRAIPVLAAGDKVQHDTFGLGTVVATEGEGEKAVASIDFGSDGVKRLLLRYAPVEKL